MAVSFSNNSAYDAGSYTNNHTLAAFNCSAANSHLVVGVANRVFTADVAGATANAVAMTLRTGATSENTNVAGVGVFDHTISNASFNVVVNTPSYRLAAVMAVALSGVDQSTPTIGTPVTAGGFSSTATASYTGTADNMLLIFGNTQGAATLTASGCTQGLNADHPDGSLGQYFAGYVVATGSAQTIGFTLGGNDNWQISIVEIKAATGAVINSGFFMFM